MAYRERTISGYECEACGTVVEADTPWADDYPEGYFITVRRVTAAQRHYLSDQIFLCTKECLIQFVSFGISAATAGWRPTTRVELAKRRSDSRYLPLTIPPAPSAGPGIPIDPDTLEPNNEDMEVVP